MLVHSRAVVDKILNDFKKITFISSIATQAIYLIYLIYAIASNVGIFAINISLSVISAIYISYTIAKKLKPSLFDKVTKRRTQHFLAISKLSVRAISLGLTLYGIHIATSQPTTLSIILAALTIMGWTLGVLFEVVTFVVEKYKDMLMSAFNADVIQPINHLRNKIPFIDHKDEPEPTKTDIYVKSLAAELQKELESKKIAKKADKKALSKAKNAMRIEKIKGFLIKKNKKAPSEIKTEEASKK